MARELSLGIVFDFKSSLGRLPQMKEGPVWGDVSYQDGVWGVGGEGRPRPSLGQSFGSCPQRRSDAAFFLLPVGYICRNLPMKETFLLRCVEYAVTNDGVRRCKMMRGLPSFVAKNSKTSS